MSEGKGLLPEPKTARQMAAALNMPQSEAQHILEGMVERGLATKDSSDRYTITGRGLLLGERVGVVKPVGEWPQHGD